ncbi:MAG TPA: hypothetical protein VIV40_37490 [Kofleriaceae bacterium]
MRSSDGRDETTPARRLRVPAALAVAFVGTSAVVSVWYGGCHTTTDPTPDAGHVESRLDARVIDASDAGDDDDLVDAGTMPDAPRDAPPADAPPT